MGKAKGLSTTSELPSNFWDGNTKKKEKEMTEMLSNS
jgi:hypothetical protein